MKIVVSLPAVEGVGAVLQDDRDVGRVGEGDEAEASRPAGLGVLHDDAVDDFAVAREVALQVVLRRFPRETADEKFSAK